MTEHRLAPLHREILSQIDTLLGIAEDSGEFPEARTRVSGWSALQHTDHMARADDGALHQLETALERDGGPRFKLAGRVILGLGWIPRGAGKAPSGTQPEARSREEVAAALHSVRDRVGALGGRLEAIDAARGRASHPVFGGLRPAQWLRFLQVHHHHHLKIVADIRRAYESGAK